MTEPARPIVLTGAGGFIGSNVALALSRLGHPVVACDTFSDADCWRYLTAASLYDVIRPDEVQGWLAAHAGRLGGIVHLGAISATTERDLTKLVKNNIRFTLDLWEFAAAHDVTFVYASSAATYGDGSHGFVDDDSPPALALLRPLNAYAWSKHVIDRRIMDDVSHGRLSPSRWAGLKFFNVYGPNEAHKGSMRSLVHQIYPLAAGGRPARLFKSEDDRYPDGGQLRDFVYVKDCCEIIVRMLAAPALTGIFNAGTGTPRSFADLAAAVYRAVGREPQIEYVEMPEELRGKYQYFTCADTTKLHAKGLAPAFHDLESGVSDYVRGHLITEFGDLQLA